MQSVIPDDVMCNILSLLPLKSMVRFTCVCKSWLTIIREAAVKKLRFSHSESEPAVLVLTYNEIGEKQAINISYMKQEGLNLAATTIVNMISPHSWHLVGTCGGLLCFATSGRDEIVMVCNPITREHVMLPKSSPCPKSHILKHAFGFDPITKKYKVVRVLCRHDLRIEAEVCAVGAVGTGSWRKVRGFNRVPRGRPVYAKGAVHWLAEPRPEHFDLQFLDHLPDSASVVLSVRSINQLHAYQRKRILSFDLGKEEFSMMQHMRIGELSRLAELDNCLSVVDTTSSNTRIEVSVMNDSFGQNFWEKYVIPVRNPHFFDWKSPMLICAQEQDGVLLIWLQHMLMTYEREGSVKRELKLTRFPVGMEFEICSGYRGSLAPLMHSNAAAEDRQSNVHFVSDKVLRTILKGNVISREYGAAPRCDSISKCIKKNGMLSH